MVVAAALELPACPGFPISHHGKARSSLHNGSEQVEVITSAVASLDAPDIPVDVCIDLPVMGRVSWQQVQLELTPLPTRDLGTARAKARGGHRAEQGLGKGPQLSQREFLGCLRASFCLHGGSRINSWFCRSPRLWEDRPRGVGVTPRSAGGWVSPSWLQAEILVKELRFLVEIQRVKSAGGNPGSAGLLALGVLMGRGGKPNPKP